MIQLASNRPAPAAPQCRPASTRERSGARFDRSFDALAPNYDPYGERDFGAFEHAGHRVFWKIDYYDRTMTYGSEDPSDPARTIRVLTIMLASETGQGGDSPAVRPGTSSGSLEFHRGAARIPVLPITASR